MLYQFLQSSMILSPGLASCQSDPSFHTHDTLLECGPSNVITSLGKKKESVRLISSLCHQLANFTSHQKQSCCGICSDTPPWRHTLHPVEAGHLDNHRSAGTQRSPGTLCHHVNLSRSEDRASHKAILLVLRRSLKYRRRQKFSMKTNLMHKGIVA